MKELMDKLETLSKGVDSISHSELLKDMINQMRRLHEATIELALMIDDLQTENEKLKESKTVYYKKMTDSEPVKVDIDEDVSAELNMDKSKRGLSTFNPETGEVSYGKKDN